MKVCTVIAAASAGERIKKQGFCSCLAYLASWAMSKSFQNYAICSREYAKLMKPEFLQLNPRVDPRIHSWTKWGFRFQEWVTKNLGGPILKHVVFQWQMPATLPPIWPTTTQHGESATTGTLKYRWSSINLNSCMDKSFLMGFISTLTCRGGHEGTHALFRAIRSAKVKAWQHNIAQALENTWMANGAKEKQSKFVLSEDNTVL